MKIYCDRLATVNPDNKGQFECPRCRGLVIKSTTDSRFECHTCGRRWRQVSDTCKTADQAERELLNKEYPDLFKGGA